MVSLRERGKYIGIIALASALGLVSGIIIGAAIGGLASWRLYVIGPLLHLLISGFDIFPESFGSTFRSASPL